MKGAGPQFTMTVNSTSVVYILAGFIAGYFYAKRRYNIYYEEGEE